MLAPATPASAAASRPLAGLLLAGCVLLLAFLAPLPAHAASQVADQVRQADDVFTGAVTDSMTRKSGRRQVTTTYDVDVERVYKGHVRETSVQVVAAPSKRACELGKLRPGQRYVFFAAEDGGGLTTDGCSGTDRASDRLVAEVEKLLGSGRPPVPPEPQKATFTRVAHAVPTAFPRLAAPGGALVLVGLLGLIVVRRLGRHA